jgi:tRNA-specific 2-thiouridylase
MSCGRVIVGVSGGVDSTVAALLLKEAGYDVVGVTMNIRQLGKYRSDINNSCFSIGGEECIASAKQICSSIGIEHYTFDCAKEFEEKILAYFSSEFLSGRTPNPCVHCNRHIKFGLLPDAARASGLDFDYYATGHYARRNAHNAPLPQLLRAKDAHKDQSYFLYNITKEQLAQHIFPLGDYTKPEIREIAEKHGLVSAKKPDSQDFYRGDRSELLGIKPKRGKFVLPSGKVVGEHLGYWNFTIGQRKGLGVAYPEPLYVIAINAALNEVVVGVHSECIQQCFEISACNWLSISEPIAPFICGVKLRSASPILDGATVEPLPNNRALVHLSGAGAHGIAPGQATVFYDGDILLGGGTIEHHIK